MLRRSAAFEEEQIDRAVKSTRKRLARLLLILASLETESDEGSVLDRISEGMLAHILATQNRLAVVTVQ